ncbi:hypothetical protein [Heyndrickxia acidicola]|uniref:Lipoprotein n=1 Tax=Heyndrickxia acidicola TaxID=209389 RepID=A0ABU6ME24_9BACI|nr:hypothetical protein [Heyndrickxia acidicola]MED1202906.1 hypothetical protein [Heyndrickxia acidicola]
MFKVGFVFFCLAMFLLNGCGMQNKKENAESPYRNVKNTVSGKKQQNQVELVENSPTIGTDIMEAKKVVRSIPGYIPDSVWINGNQMWVVVRANKDLSNHAKLKEAARIHEKLVQAIPQFKINVKVN